MEARGYHRSRVLLSGILETAKGDFFARLRDFSRTGARVEAELIPPVGSELVLRRGETRISGRVVWTTQTQFGFEFFDVIDEAELLVHIGGPK
jgi:hypothetical protein